MSKRRRFPPRIMRLWASGRSALVDLGQLGREAPAACVRAEDDPLRAQLAHGHLDETGRRVRAAHFGADVLGGPDDPDAALPVVPGVGADERGVGVPGRQDRHVGGARLAGEVRDGPPVRVLKDRHLQLDRAADDRVQLGPAALQGDPELHADHRAVAHAAVHLAKAFLTVLGVQIDQPEHATGGVRNRPEHFIIGPADLGGRRVVRGQGRPQGYDQSLDAQPAGKLQQLVDSLFDGAGHAGQMDVSVPDRVLGRRVVGRHTSGFQTAQDRHGPRCLNGAGEHRAAGLNRGHRVGPFLEWFRLGESSDIIRRQGPRFKLTAMPHFRRGTRKITMSTLK